MFDFCRNFRLIHITLLCMMFVTSSLTAQMAYAQALLDDFILPVIESEKIDPDNTLVFGVSATDNDKIKSVTLHYRVSGEKDFITANMLAKPSSSFYSVTLKDEMSVQTSIDYYFEAEDRTGNKILKGYSFNPFTRYFDSNLNSKSNADSGIATTPEKSKTLYYLLGLAAIGTLAALAGGGGGGSGGGEPCSASGCELTVNITSP